jgi:hypothetical protein
VSRYLHSGWHEFFIPVTSRGGRAHLRIWIDMEDVVPMLRKLDAIYGDAEHPYAIRPEEIPDAQRTLLELVSEHAIGRPDAVRRAAAPRALATELHERFGVKRSDYPIDYPPGIDQVDLDPAQAMFALPFILDREAVTLPDPER